MEEQPQLEIKKNTTCQSVSSIGTHSLHVRFLNSLISLKCTVYCTCFGRWSTHLDKSYQKGFIYVSWCFLTSSSVILLCCRPATSRSSKSRLHNTQEDTTQSMKIAHVRAARTNPVKPAALCWRPLGSCTDG